VIFRLKAETTEIEEGATATGPNFDSCSFRL
jgi:hypothetical protein